MPKRQPRKPPMFTGPNGERRPTSPIGAMVSALEEIVSKYEDQHNDGPGTEVRSSRPTTEAAVPKVPSDRLTA